MSAAQFWTFAGNRVRANELLEVAFARPVLLGVNDWAYIAHIRFLNAEYDKSVQAFDNSGILTPTVAAWNAAAMACSGRTRDALELGRRFLSDARSNWYGAAPVTDLSIARWVLQAHPIVIHEHWYRLRDGLKLAGIPVDGLEREIPSSPSHKQRVDV